MKKTLGLDLGTNSIGWAIIQENNSTPIIDKGTHIYSEGVAMDAQKKEYSKAQLKTNYKGARVQKSRRRKRKQDLLKVLIESKMCPLSIEDLNTWIKSKQDYPNKPEFLKWLSTDGIDNPYYFRDAASKTKITPQEFGRALYHICQRRGFKSNRLDSDSDGEAIKLKEELLGLLSEEMDNAKTIALLEECKEDYSESEDKDCKRILRKFDIEIKAVNKNPSLSKTIIEYLQKTVKEGAVQANITELNKSITEGGFKTLGQYFYHCLEAGKKIRNNYTGREEHYEKEFDVLCETQTISEALKNKLYLAIFYQRPLKSQKGLVGKCTFEPKKSRCPISNPQFERFRMYSYINSIRYYENGDTHVLNDQQKELIFPLFFRVKKNFDFLKITNKLFPKNAPRFNYKPYDKVSNCPILGNIKRCFGTDADNLKTAYTLGSDKSHYEIEQMIWHALSDFENPEKLNTWLQNNFANTDFKKLKRLSQSVPNKEYASLSLKAINKILPYLKKGYLYSHAVFMANIKAVLSKELQNEEDYETVDFAIANILDNDALNRKKISAYNSFIFWFNEQHKKNSSKNYTLDIEDLDKVEECIYNEWGKHTFQKLEAEQKENIKASIVSIAEKEINSKITPKPLPFKRIDEQLIEFLIDQFGEENIDVSKLYHPSDIQIFKPAVRNKKGALQLGSPRSNSVKNPMAMRTLFQLRRLVNILLDEGKIDEHTVVHIELARELNDANKRIAIKNENTANEKARENAEQDIIRLYKEQSGKTIVPNETDILKYLLWKEQNQKCLYTDECIGICDFIGPNPNYDIEHTIPRSLYPDNSMANKTLASAKYNRDVKKNRMPSELNNHDAILARIEPWIKKKEALAKNVAYNRKAKGLETKEQKDKRIQKKHEYALQLNYWKKKVETFTRTDVPEGFKISQLVDTGIITRYATLYLKSTFTKVYTVKGTMVAEFRKLWGIQGKGSIKNRSNHAHHCIDAITIAAITKARYDKLAQYYKNKDSHSAEDKIFIQKPWQSFTEDVLAVPEQLLISHHSPDNTGKQSKKVLRKRGVVQKTETGKTIYQKGDTVRSGLHSDSFYGAIQQDDKTVYVIRKALNGLKQSDVANIVDAKIGECIAKKIESKEILLKKDSAKNLCISLEDNQQVWFNKEKGVEIKKVRIKTNLKNPLEIKQHTPAFLSKQVHKQKYYAITAGGGNYGAVVFTHTDAKGKEKTAMEIINSFKLYPLIKTSTGLSVDEGIKHLLSEKYNDVKILYTLTTGIQVIFYDDNIEELKSFGIDELSKRMYVMYKCSGSQVYLKHQSTALPIGELKKIDNSNEFSKPASKFNNSKVPIALYLTITNFKFAVENYHFKIDSTGKIQWLNA